MPPLTLLPANVGMGRSANRGATPYTLSGRATSASHNRTFSLSVRYRVPCNLFFFWDLSSAYGGSPIAASEAARFTTPYPFPSWRIVP
jgi:hypothetical protein